MSERTMRRERGRRQKRPTRERKLSSKSRVCPWTQGITNRGKKMTLRAGAVGRESSSKLLKKLRCTKGAGCTVKGVTKGSQLDCVDGRFRTQWARLKRRVTGPSLTKKKKNKRGCRKGTNVPVCGRELLNLEGGGEKRAHRKRKGGGRKNLHGRNSRHPEEKRGRGEMRKREWAKSNTA